MKPQMVVVILSLLIALCLWQPTMAQMEPQAVDSTKRGETPSTEGGGGELDFGAVDASQVQSTRIEHPHAALATPIGLAVIALTIVFVTLALRQRRASTPFRYHLRQLPVSGRVLVTFLVLILGLVHIFALLEVYLQSRVINASAEEYFFYMKPTKLAATTHAHLFGHVTMYSLVSLIFLFTGVGEVFKTLVLSAAISGGLWDVTSWWLIKYASGKFEALSMLTGAMASLGFLTMVIIILHEIWLTKETVTDV